MASRKPFTLLKRKSVYYVRFRNPDGTRSTPKSTGETARGRAERWAIDYLQKGNGQIVKKENVTFSAFSKDFFAWDGVWATDRKVRGLRLSLRHCIERGDILKNHLAPFFGGMRLTAIDRAIIKDFRNDMFRRGYSGNTINKCLSALKAVLEAAEEQSLIQYVPRIDRAAENPKTKGILTLDEVKRLFAFEWTTRPATNHPARPDYLGQAGNLIACMTGLRLSEIQGLQHRDIDFQNRAIIIRRSWNNRLLCLNTETKSGKERTVFFSGIVEKVLHRLIDMNPYGQGGECFVFFGGTAEAPKDPRGFSDSLFYAMELIGIHEAERKRRGISFHSHRHFLNSLLVNSKIPLHKIQALVGHSDNKMTERYYHADDMQDVLQITDNLFQIN